MESIWRIKLDNGAELDVRGSEDLGLKRGDLCVFRKDFYEELGTILRQVSTGDSGTVADSLPQIIRTAGDPELAEAAENSRKACESLRTVNEWIDKLHLEMSTVNAHYSLDRKLLTVQFCAEGRVDFRELVKELARALSVRIELRQIGVRDETGIFGGIAVCGQVLCCSRFLKEFSSINVKMAKEQDLMLTPSSISGACGRLKCCLKYEHEGYLELEKGMPRKGEFCETPSGRGKITDRNLLTRKVTVMFENGTTAVFTADDVKTVPHEKRKENNSACEHDKNKNRSHEQNNHNGKRKKAHNGNGAEK